jgi:hypothetical protein
MAHRTDLIVQILSHLLMVNKIEGFFYLQSTIIYVKAIEGI